MKVRQLTPRCSRSSKRSCRRICRSALTNCVKSWKTKTQRRRNKEIVPHCTASLPKRAPRAFLLRDYLSFDPGRGGDSRPFRQVVTDESGELLRAPARHVVALRCERRNHVGRFRGFVAGSRQTFDDLARRSGGRQQPKPARGIESWKSSFGNRRQVWR